MNPPLKAALFLSLAIPLWLEAGTQIVCAQSIKSVPSAVTSAKSASTRLIIPEESADHAIIKE